MVMMTLAMATMLIMMMVMMTLAMMVMMTLAMTMMVVMMNKLLFNFYLVFPHFTLHR